MYRYGNCFIRQWQVVTGVQSASKIKTINKVSLISTLVLGNVDNITVSASLHTVPASR